MRRLAVPLLALCLALPLPALAARKAPVQRSGSAIGHGQNFGLGLSLGAPTAITGKYFLDSQLALDFGLDLGRGGVAIHGDALWHLAELARSRDLSLQFYLGVGAQLGSGYRHWYYRHYYSGADLGVRVPVGLAMWLNRAPFEFFLEAGPEIWLLNGYGGGFGSLGFRYYF